jgi:xanthine dehydrogenase accessory factor
MRPTTWYEALNQCQQQGLGYVLITVLMSAGSAPREAGCKMLVTGDEQFDTIGGGHLEFAAVDAARELLAENRQAQKTVSYPLSSSLGQCCGGAVKILYEAHVDHSQHVAIFGAGHVAQSLVPMLAQLPVQIRWIDSRENFFNDASDTTSFDTTSFDTMLAAGAASISVPSSKSAARVPRSILALSNVTAITNDDPIQELAALPNNTWVIILTHNHQLDYELVESALKHPSLGFIGMIGSQTKAKRFVTKLEHRGFDAVQRAKLTSPIGDLSIPGKRPVEVSVSVCAQLIKLLHASPLVTSPLDKKPVNIESTKTDRVAKQKHAISANTAVISSSDESGYGRSK